MQKIVTASLEGMRVVVEANCWRLEEYDFSVNQFRVVEEANWPLALTDASRWLTGWNRCCRMLGANALTPPDNSCRIRAVA